MAGLGWEHSGAQPSERVTVLGAPLLSVFSLHSFVCRLSETFQESDSLLQPGKDCPKTRVTAVIKLYLVLNIVGFSLIAIIQNKLNFQ